MSGIKIFNDPIYGLVSYPFPFIYTLIDHPYFQRLRRIKQLGMSSMVYPGATHTRFHHALGALHLCDRLIRNLKVKGIIISDEEHEAVLIACLLHDIGHGPFSHALEGILIAAHHEELTIQIMNLLNEQYDGRLSLAMAIFKHQYTRPFLSQIISSQLDVDRMDYLNRDSFYTGVAEGVIGYDRLIKMMNVVNDQLVVEEKGIHSIEKFLLSRHFMYQQVYLHHASLVADTMLKTFVQLFKNVGSQKRNHSTSLEVMLFQKPLNLDQALKLFLLLDDSDIMMLIKKHLASEDRSLKLLAEGLIHRKLFGIKKRNHPFNSSEIKEVINQCSDDLKMNEQICSKLVNLGRESSIVYSTQDEIQILLKTGGDVVTFGDLSRLKTYHDAKELHFITYPRNSYSNYS